MSEEQQAFAVLRRAAQTCSAALTALRDPTTAAQVPNTGVDVSLDTRLNDYLSLLSLLYQDATKLAIALKPSNPTYSAVISPAQELATHADALASCAYSISGAEHGYILSREVRWSAEDVLSGLESLLRVYTSDTNSQAVRAGSGAGEPYLIRTGAAHEAIDRARGISHSNQEAVRKRWQGVLGGLSDCENEVDEMVAEEEVGSDDEGQSGNEDYGDFDGDDGWDELGGTTLSKKGHARASHEELMRLKTTVSMLIRDHFFQAHTLFKFAHTLMKRMDHTILQPSSTMASPPPSTLDKLLFNADMLLKAADELVHALYVPQASEVVSKKSKGFVAFVDDLRADLASLSLVTLAHGGQGDTDRITDLTQKIVSVGLANLPGEEENMAKERRWFDTCFVHISKSATGLS